jgi:hypothetical protein
MLLNEGHEMDKRFDDSRWPIITIRFGPESDDAEWQLLMDSIRERCKGRERFAVVADGTAMKAMPTARQRKIGAELAIWIEETKPQPRWPIIAWANVIVSPLVRGAITAILWIKTPPHPQKHFATWQEAFDWAKSEVAKAK